MKKKIFFSIITLNLKNKTEDSLWQGMFNTNLRVCFSIVFPNRIRRKNDSLYLSVLQTISLLSHPDYIIRKLYNITQLLSILSFFKVIIKSGIK